MGGADIYRAALPRAYRMYVTIVHSSPDGDVLFPDYEPAHRILARNQITAIENAGGDVDLVTGKRCTIAAFPFRCELADGGFVRLVALVEE